MAEILVRCLSVLLLCFGLTNGKQGCLYNGITHTVGDRFDFVISTPGLADYEISFLCTGNGLVTIGCGIPNMTGPARDATLVTFIPPGVKEYFGCLEYICTETVGWVPTGQISPTCASEEPGDTTTSGGDGMTTTDGTTPGDDATTT
ncbi:uncharacterized protein LOC135210103 [Macrobrachium nipponense]|uniref:uncharacterized protein LOC135210103 n=1 Tax=Macrobrachium nipponense TaxID=159736 RepID=UPI0030C81631